MSTKPAKKTATKKTAAAAPAKEKKTKKTESKEAPATEPVEKKERKRRVVDKESVDAAFLEIQTRVSAEIEKLRESEGKVRGIKFLRSINKAFNTLHRDTKRVMKLKKKNNRKKGSVSGFLKPIKISEELAKFLAWDPAQSYSRVSVTKHICKYIKDNHLYDDADKRKILCDDKLRVLLKYDPNNVPLDDKGEPAYLNYFRLQKHLKSHFIKVEGDKTATSDAKAKKTKKTAVKAVEKTEKPAEKAPAADKVAEKATAKPVGKAAVKTVEVDDEDLDDE
jgi:chromatin remodeling complex protein RSC6